MADTEAEKCKTLKTLLAWGLCILPTYSSVRKFLNFLKNPKNSLFLTELENLWQSFSSGKTCNSVFSSPVGLLPSPDLFAFSKDSHTSSSEVQIKFGSHQNLALFVIIIFSPKFCTLFRRISKNVQHCM